MLIKILLVISIIVQTLATAYALRLVRATKYNSVWILFIVGFSLLSVERFVQLLMAGGHYVPRWWFGYLGIVVSVCLSIGVMYAHKLFKYIDRLNRQRQLLNKTHPYGRAPHRGEGPVALLEGAARRTRPAAVVGPDVAFGAFARGALCGPARDHRQHDLRHRRGDPLAARNFELPFAAGAQTISDWRAASRTSSRAARRCTACASASRPTCARNGSTPTSR